MPFHDTLSARDRRLAQRMEGLGDVVVGFAMSQLVVHLPQITTRLHPLDFLQFVAYFATFAVLVVLWLAFHRLMSTAFVPRPFDLFVAFVHLAFISLMPYAMNTLFTSERGRVTDEIATTGLAAYSACFLGTLATSSVLSWRNLRRGWYHFDAGERDDVWANALRTTSLSVVMAGALVLDLRAGPALASYALFALFIPMLVIRRFFRKAPPAARLRIPEPVTSG